MERVDAAEKEVVVLTSKDPVNPRQTGNNSGAHQQTQDVAGVVQWHTPVTTVHQALFTNMHEVTSQFTTLTGEQVIWQEHTIEVDQQHLTAQQPISIVTQTSDGRVAEYTTAVPPPPPPPLAPLPASQPQAPPPLEPSSQSPQQEADPKKKIIKMTRQRSEKQTGTPKKKSKVAVSAVVGIPSTHLEENAQEVRERFEKGCECQEENCFKGLSPEYVYRHRLNIAELTKAEHDMYLMGVTMAVLTNPEETVRHKERRRLRAQYVFQGRRVCLDAFLYLENCTHYQLKRIRKHVMTHGVAPRIHGNHGKKPHNTFSLDIYRHTTSFLRHFIQRHTPGSSVNQNTSSQQVTAATTKCKSKSGSKTPPLYLPAEITRKTIHNAYREYCEHFEPSIKVMGYTTFRHFMKEQFPHVKFCKVEGGVNKPASNSGSHPQQQSQQQQTGNTPIEVEIVNQQGTKLQGDDTVTIVRETPVSHQDPQSATIITTSGEVQQVTAIPVVVEQEARGLSHQQQTAFIVTPVSQMIQAPISVSTITDSSYTSYQLTTAPPRSYTTHQHLTDPDVVTITSIPNTAASAYRFTTL
ncbi:uncharacterized protein LOC110840943 isoform X2 [Zootermopsis nevadensis]|uniref:uncharacterized protein LOC110840943 isoform X2 n=1 Tax=Zootermopsis nevadensis TaxID=136037 RepID=UPI000B8E52DF|nr:uncharacterized protein LOC110840943 isoform X2 [Zootermopsis nevadensis]